MGLSSIFRSKTAAFEKAIKVNDLDAVQALSQQKCRGAGFALLDPHTYNKMTMEMMGLLAAAEPAVWERWSPLTAVAGPELRQIFLRAMFDNALKAGRIDLLNPLLESDINFNRGKAKDHALIQIMECGLPGADKLVRIRKMLSAGCDGIEDADYFLHRAAALNFIEGVGFFAALGFDIHRNNEQLLRTAAHNGQEALCRYLVDSLGADAALAARTAAQTGNISDRLYLEQFTKNTAENKPATLESLSAEVAELKAMVKSLAAALAEARNPEKTLDKPSLPHLRRSI
jgi:hypothetical protein